MENYLTGYLDVIPESERKKVSEVIKENEALMVAGGWSEAEFQKAIDELVHNHKKLSTNIPQKDVLDSVKHNTFFSNLQTDLTLLFAESDLIESGLNNYHRLYEGILSDLQKEITSLKQRVSLLRLTSESENGSIIRSFDFSTDANSEIYSAANSYLFKDRDNTNIVPVVVERNEATSMIMLDKIIVNDRIRDKDGKVTAQIAVVDRRGTPIDHEVKGTYTIDKAIDNSMETYWGEVILSDEPIRVRMPI